MSVRHRRNPSARDGRQKRGLRGGGGGADGEARDPMMERDDNYTLMRIRGGHVDRKIAERGTVLLERTMDGWG